MKWVTSTFTKETWKPPCFNRKYLFFLFFAAAAYYYPTRWKQDEAQNKRSSIQDSGEKCRFLRTWNVKSCLMTKRKKNKTNSLQNEQPYSCKKYYIKENTVWTFGWFMVSKLPSRHECTREVAMLTCRQKWKSATLASRVLSNVSVASKTRRTHANLEPIVLSECHYLMKFKFLQTHWKYTDAFMQSFLVVCIAKLVPTILELNLYQRFRVFCGQVFTPPTQLQNRSWQDQDDCEMDKNEKRSCKAWRNHCSQFYC